MDNLEYPDKLKSGVSRYEKEGEEWITLKEASQISGYSPDYIGELIRKGKIPGKQIYYNVAWLVPKKAILEYKEKQKQKGKKKLTKKEKFFEFLNESKRKIFLQIEILKLFFKTFKNTLFIFLILLLLLAGLFSFIFVSIEKKTIQKEIYQPSIEKIEGPSF